MFLFLSLKDKLKTRRSFDREEQATLRLNVALVDKKNLCREVVRHELSVGKEEKT